MITRDDLAAALAALAERRPVFHSEADFQHELAWIIRESRPDVAIRLERPINLDGSRGHVDVWVNEGVTDTVIELKYWTRASELTVRAEQYRLREHGRQPLARYDLWKDVGRTERLIEERSIGAGYVVALTNVRSYWNVGRPAGSIDEALRTHEGHEVSGPLKLSERASDGTRKGRESTIGLRTRYVTQWRDYSRAGEFRYLLLDVGEAMRAAST